MNATTGYSVQQIKFEFLSYMKEFGANGADWFIGCSTGPTVCGESAAIVPEAMIWISKPALSARAARMVHEHMVSRHRVQIAPGAGAVEAGNWIYMYRDRCGDETSTVETQRPLQKQVETDRQLS